MKRRDGMEFRLQLQRQMRTTFATAFNEQNLRALLGFTINMR